MNWKLTIDVIFNSFPLIKNKNLILFLCHCGRSVVILRLQSRHCKQSLAIQWLQPRHCERSVVILRLQPRHCERSLVIPQLQPRHCGRNMGIQWLQPRHCEQSEAIQWFQIPSLRAKQWFQRGCGEKIPRIKRFKGYMNFLMQGLMMLRGKWTFQCKHWKFLGVYGQKNARTQRN